MAVPMRVLPALVELRLALFCAVVQIVHRATAQSHFTSSGQPNLQRWSGNLQGQQLPQWQAGQPQQARHGGSQSSFQGGGVAGLGSASYMNRPSPLAGSSGSAVLGGSYGIGSPELHSQTTAQGGERGEPEHLQLLGLSADLTRQARFGEAKAALAAAAQLTGGGLEIVAQAELLRWRMGLRQITAAEIHSWLGWRHLARASDSSGASSPGGLNEPSDREWAEGPSSRSPKAGSRLESTSDSGSSFAYVAIATLVVLAIGLSLSYAYVHAMREHSKDQQPLASSLESPAREVVQDERQNDEAPLRMPTVVSDPALDVGTDDDFLAGLAGLDEFQQLSGMCSRADSECSSDGGSSESLKGKENRQATSEHVSQDRQLPEETSKQEADATGNSRRWARSACDQEVHVALAAVEDLLMEEEEWEDSTLSHSAMAEKGREGETSSQQAKDASETGVEPTAAQRDQRSRLVPVKEDGEDAAVNAEVHRALEELGQEGDADDEWEEFGRSQEHDVQRLSHSASDDQGGKMEQRTLLLSQYLPEHKHDEEVLEDSIGALQATPDSQDEDNEDIWEQPEADGWDGHVWDRDNVLDTKSEGRKLDDSLSGDDLARKYAAAIANIHEQNDDDEWAWGRVVENIDPETEKRDEDEAIAAAKAFAASWKPQQEVWFAGPDGPRPTWLATPDGPRSLSGYVDDKPTLADKMRRDAGRSSSAQAVTSSSHNEAHPKVDKQDLEFQHQEAPSNQYVYFASPKGRGRTWYPANASSGMQAEGSAPSDSKKVKDVRADNGEESFQVGRPTRFRPTGCYVRLKGGAELFLPVEHMQPRTEAITTAIRDRMRGIERLLVRELDEEQVTMLTESEAKAKANEIDARKVLMEEGIAVLRQGYDPRKWIKGSISAVQANGIYVSVVAGKDAFVPVAEMPTKFTAPDEEDSDKVKPTLQIGQSADVRVIRHSWQTDTFVASMLSYEESIARHNSTRNSGGPYSMPAAARALSADPFRNSSAGSSGDRPRVQSPGPDHGKNVKKLAEKGFSLVSDTTASELNAWLKQSTQDQKNKAKGSKTGIMKTEKTYIVNVVRGMAGEVCGQMSVSTRVSEKEVRDEAIAMVTKAGKLKAGQDHKGVTISKNIITVKL